MEMHARTAIMLLALVTPALAGCIAGDAEEGPKDQLPSLASGAFTVGAFVQDLEDATEASLVNARVENLQLEYNQTRVTMVDWRSFTPKGNACELVTTMSYEGQGRSGGFLVHNEDEPCPVAIGSQPSVAETVALVDRVSLAEIREDVVGNAPVFSLELAGYCSYATAEDGVPVHVWNGAGLDEHTGHVRCGGGTGSALSLAITLPSTLGSTQASQTHVILEQVPAR